MSTAKCLAVVQVAFSADGASEGKISVKRSRNNDYIYPFFEKLDLFSRRARKNTQMTEEHIYTYRVLVPGTITINPDIGDTYLPSHSQSNKPGRSR